MRSRLVVPVSLIVLAAPVAATAAVPNDPRVAEQWGVSNTGQSVRGVTGIAGVDVNLPAAWDYVTGGDAVVAVASSGVDLLHPDLAANIWTNPGETGTNAQGQDRRTNGIDDDGNGRVDDWRGWDFVNNDNNPSDDNGQGTKIAGVVGAVGNNGVGVTGVAQRTKLMALKVGSNSRLDNSVSSDAAAAAAMYAGAKGADVFIGAFAGSSLSTTLDDAIAANPQMLFVFPAGDTGANTDSARTYPCTINRPNVICVTAISSQGALPTSANRGVTTVDLGAPGAAILTTSPFTLKVDEPFETPIAGRWATAGGFTALDWGVSTSPLGDGSKALTINGNTAPVASSTTSAIASARIDLAGCLAPVLHVTASTGYTNGQFDILITENANTNASGSWAGLATLAGTQPSTSIVRDLSAYNGKDVALILGSSTGAGNGGTGPVVDDLKITCRPNAYTGQEYDWFGGTSAAAAWVAGAAALVASQYPAADMTYLRSAILGSTTAMPSLAGKIATEGRLNVLGAIDTTPPAAFTVTGPADGATAKDKKPTFTFNGATDDKTGIARYELFVDGKLAGSTNGAGRSITPTSPLKDGARSWRIEAVNGAGLRRSTTTRTIKIGDAKPPKIDADTAGSTSHATIASKGLTVACDIGEAGKCGAEVSLSKADAKKLGITVPKGAKSIVVAKVSKKTNAKGKVTLKLKPSKKVGNALKASGAKVTFKITVTATDKAGNVAKKVTLSVKS